MPIYRADCPMASIFFLLLLTSFASLGLSQNLSSADSQENVLAKNESNNTRSPLRRSGCGPPVWTAEAFVTTVVYTTIFCVSVMGNCLVIVTIINNRQMRTVTNMFLLNLGAITCLIQIALLKSFFYSAFSAISDLILTVFCIPTTLIGPILFKCFLFGPVMCKVFYYVQRKSCL